MKGLCSRRVFAQVALENHPGPSFPDSSLACVASEAMRTDLKDVCTVVLSLGDCEVLGGMAGAYHCVPSCDGTGRVALG